MNTDPPAVKQAEAELPPVTRTRRGNHQSKRGLPRLLFGKFDPKRVSVSHLIEVDLPDASYLWDSDRALCERAREQGRL